MLRLSLSVAALLVATTLFGQNPNVNITDPDFTGSNECDCQNVFTNGSLAHFFDSGGGANYGNNEDEEIVFCPDLNTGTKVSVAFGVNAGFSWAVDASDTVYVYDGNSTSAPLLGAHNSATDPNGFFHQASWNNPTGCLTVRFVSDGSVTQAGWAANVTCGNAPQPYTPHIYGYINGANFPDSTLQSLAPADTGYLDICWGDSALLSASGSFIHSLENTGYGYSQNVNNCTYEWDFSDGTSQTGKDVWFNPPSRAGYLVTLRMTDPIGWIQVIQAKIRVSTIPSFATTIAYPDTICLGETSELAGGVTLTDTVGADPTQGAFEIGGVFAGLVYLPDGSGVAYSDSVNISGFGIGQTVTAGTDVQNFCVTMEHSYLGDLEMILTCPNGTSATIFNSFGPGGLVAGGFNGGGTYMGDAFDNNIANPGIGWEYCWNSNGATFGTLATEFANNNTLPTTISNGQAMNPNGIYLPEDPWTSFIGCPLNGAWTITVQDNLSIDDGYIFEWGIFFDPQINPNTEFYTPLIVSDGWVSDPTILVDTDTLIQVMPTTPGQSCYTFFIQDDFQCFHDTTICIEVLPPMQLMPDSATCTLSMLFGNNTVNPGYWTAYPQDGTGNVIISDSTVANPNVLVTESGVYVFIYTDSYCGDVDTVLVNFAPDPNLPMQAPTCANPGETVTITLPDSANYQSIVWFDNTTNGSTTGSGPGTYSVTVIDGTGCTNQDNITVLQSPTVGADDVICGLTYDLSSTSVTGGWWETPVSVGSVDFQPSSTADDPTVNVGSYGQYQFEFTDSTCGQSNTQTITFLSAPDAIPNADAELCEGEFIVLDGVNGGNGSVSYAWNNGFTGQAITVTETGYYAVTVTNSCGSQNADWNVLVNSCNIVVPNVFSPNADGYNDNLVFLGLENWPGSNLQVFNRWGKMIYEDSSYSNDWDGRINGTAASDGTYYYILTVANPKDDVFTGTFQLMTGN